MMLLPFQSWSKKETAGERFASLFVALFLLQLRGKLFCQDFPPPPESVFPLNSLTSSHAEEEAEREFPVEKRKTNNEEILLL